jgi:peptide/nickel transport system ATP-binding protein
LTAPLLVVEQLSVSIATRRGTVAAVRDVSLTVEAGEIVGVVGESGSGKSVTALAVMGILPPAARVTNGRILLEGRLLDPTPLRQRRRDGLAMIFQNPRAALNPIRPVGRQIVDALQAHAALSHRQAAARAMELLEQVRIREPQRRFWSYSFELSGGMCQRVLIAIALACRPRLLIADEPTTGLDVTTQKVILDLLVELAAEEGLATLLITHDLPLAGERCARIVVMQGGRTVESGRADDILLRPRAPYTRELVAATPQATSGLAGSAALSPDSRGSRQYDVPLLEVRGLRRDFRLRHGTGTLARLWAEFRRTDAARPVSMLSAVDEIDLAITAGESVGLVGESGSGKSTLAALIVRLIDPSAGRIVFLGDDVGTIPARRFTTSKHRRDIQMVFQDATASLDPRQTAFAAIAEPIRRLGRLDRARPLTAVVAELAEMVGLPTPLLARLPHQLSGGEKARVGIARAIALRPALLVLDEPTAALDVRVQDLILDLLIRLRGEFAMTYLFISHDLAVVRRICDRILVMQAGKIVDSGPTEQLLSAPSHPYTRMLVAAIPRLPSGHRYQGESAPGLRQGG